MLFLSDFADLGLVLPLRASTHLPALMRFVTAAVTTASTLRS